MFYFSILEKINRERKTSTKDANTKDIVDKEAKKDNTNEVNHVCDNDVSKTKSRKAIIWMFRYIDRVKFRLLIWTSFIG